MRTTRSLLNHDPSGMTDRAPEYTRLHTTLSVPVRAEGAGQGQQGQGQQGGGQGSQCGSLGATRGGTRAQPAVGVELTASVKSLLQEHRFNHPRLAETLLRDEAHRSVVERVRAAEGAPDAGDEQLSAYLEAMDSLGREPDEDIEKGVSLSNAAEELQRETESFTWTEPLSEELLRLRDANKAVRAELGEWVAAHHAFTAVARSEERSLRRAEGCCISCGQPLSRMERTLGRSTHLRGACWVAP